MKKNFYYLVTFMVALMTFGLTACGSDNDEPDNDNSDLVGTWSVEYSTGYGYTDYSFEYIQLKADGTYIDVQEDEDEAKGYFVSYGNWNASDTQITLQVTSGPLKGSSFVYDIVKKEKNRITVTMFGVTAYLVKISDSIINKYL